MSDIDINSTTPETTSDDESPAPEAGETAAPEAEGGETPIIEPEILDETADDDVDEGVALEPETIDDEASAAEADAVAEPTTPEAEPDVVTEDELIEQQPVVDNPFTRPGRWFVVHTQSGYEKKVKQNLEARIHSMNAEEAVYEVVIPMEDYVDFRNGKRVVNQRKMFPGYLLVRAELDDTAWFVIRNTPGVTGFVGQGAKPSPLPRRDVEAFLMPKGGEEQVATRAKPRLEYELGETVRVKEGPFADFSGEVIELNEDQLKLKVLVNIFGRETPVELEFSKVAKL
jgi:transcriptional antiterminator NusG